jgi:ribonuclease R
MKNTGKAYITSDSLDEDVFVAASNTNRALHGDTVRVQLFPKRKDRKTEGKIVEILQRAKTRFAVSWKYLLSSPFLSRTASQFLSISSFP